MINNALNDKPLPVYGDGMQVRDWLYVYDHCTAIFKVLTDAPPGEIYNIGGCNEKTNMSVVELILDRLKKPKSLIKHVTDRPGHDAILSTLKIINRLGWRPSVSSRNQCSPTGTWPAVTGLQPSSRRLPKYYDSMLRTGNFLNAQLTANKATICIVNYNDFTRLCLRVSVNLRITLMR
jgi:hypothetical protein